MKIENKASMIRRNKFINNLPKYDVGTTPINSGYQMATNSVPVGYVSLLGTNLENMVSGLRQANTAQVLNSAVQIGSQIPGMIAKGSAGKLAGGLGAATSAISLYGDILNKKSFDGLGGADLDAVASKNTEYRNGVAYQTTGGVDEGNIMKSASLRDTSENLGLSTSAIGLGAGIGSIIAPGIGTAIGAGIGLLGSLFGWSKSELREQRRRLQNFRTASNAANLLNEAVAASLGLRNEFYATHADEGLSPHRGKKNALVGGGEVITKHDKYGNVVDAVMEPITGLTPERADVIPVHLNDNDGVLGNQINPFTGNRFAVDGRNNINDPAALTQLVAIQDMMKREKNRIPKYNDGKYMNLLSMLPGIIEMGVGAKLSHSYAKDASMAMSPYAQNNNAAAALEQLGNLRYDPYGMYRDLNAIDKQAIYNMNQASLSPALRMAMLSTHFSNRMKNRANIDIQAQQINNQYKAAYADALMKAGEAEATRRLQANALYNDLYAKAVAARRKGIETGWLTGLKGIDAAIGNYLNNYWTNRNIGSYELNYKTTPVDLEQINKQMASGFKIPALPKNSPLPFTTPTKYNVPTRAERDELYKLILGV